MSSNQYQTTKHPKQFGFKSWWQVLLRSYKKMQQDNLSLLAAGIAFYFLLALFPMLAAIVSLYGLFVNDAVLSEHMAHLVGIVPIDSRYIIEEQITKVLNVNDAALSTGFLSGLGLTIYSAGKGSTALITACNITYSESKSRGFFRSLLMRIVMTISIMLILITFLLLIIAVPIILSAFNAPGLTEFLIKVSTWPLLLVFSILLLGGLYRSAPNRASAKWRWISPGATVSGVLWVSGSFAFNIYVTQYASYNETYGSVGGIVILLMWFYITAFIILLGAEFNAALELQTKSDTTVGPDSPIGKRGAYVADHEGMKSKGSERLK